MKAAHNIAKDEEIFNTYVDNDLPFEERQNELMKGWQFECKCEKCKYDQTPEGKLEQMNVKIAQKLCKELENIDDEKVNLSKLPEILHIYNSGRDYVKMLLTPDLAPILIKLRNWTDFVKYIVDYVNMALNKEPLEMYHLKIAASNIMCIQELNDVGQMSSEVYTDVKNREYMLFTEIFNDDREAYSYWIEKVHNKVREEE